MRWVWNDEKNRRNKRDHGLSFEAAQFVFEDRLIVTHPDGDRWQSVGMVGNVVLFVVHTWPEIDASGNDETGRIISARKATSHERRAYEEGDF